MIWKRDTEKWENMGRSGLTKPGGEYKGEGGVNGIGFLAKPWIQEVSVTQQCPGEVRCLGTYLQAASQNREEVSEWFLDGPQGDFRQSAGQARATLESLGLENLTKLKSSAEEMLLHHRTNTDPFRHTGVGYP